MRGEVNRGVEGRVQKLKLVLFVYLYEGEKFQHMSDLLVFPPGVFAQPTLMAWVTSDCSSFFSLGKKAAAVCKALLSYECECERHGAL